MSKKRRYPSTELPTAQRELIARLVGPLEARGLSRSVFRDVLADLEIMVPKSSLDRWVHAHSSTGSIFTAEKASGAAPLLDNEQCEIAAGWVLSQNDSNQVVSLASFSKFCESALASGLRRRRRITTCMPSASVRRFAGEDQWLHRRRRRAREDDV
jgi:hypothetical protein